jgi:chromosomal replication initiator protein
MLTGKAASVELAQEALGDLDRHLIAPVKPENVLLAVAQHFGIEAKDLMSGNRHRTVSLARSVAMFLIRKTAKLSFPEIGARLGKRNHSTVISACRRIDSAVTKNETFAWSSPLGERSEEASELVARLEDQARAMG